MRSLTGKRKISGSRIAAPARRKSKHNRIRKFKSQRTNPHSQSTGRRYETAGSKETKQQSILAWKLGRRSAMDYPLPDGAEEQRHVQECWQRAFSSLGKPLATGNYMTVMKAFIDGYSSSKLHLRKPDWLLLPGDRRVGAVVMAMNEEQSIAAAIRELERMPLDEIFVVVNGSTDASLQTARTSSRAVILHYNEALGHDVGRAIGAKISTADIMVFIDADIPVAAEQLISFILAASRGTDVALNDLSRYVGKFSTWDEVTILKGFLNRSNHRADLSVNSMTAVPHALSRRAIDLIGSANLAVPPKAQAIALQKNLRIEIGGSVNVFKTNRHRMENTGLSNPVAKLIIGDHLEALSWAMQEGDSRLKFKDQLRRRDRCVWC